MGLPIREGDNSCWPKDNLLVKAVRFSIKLGAVDWDWVNFQVFRRKHADPDTGVGCRSKLVADHLGHTLDVNQNVYTRTLTGRRRGRPWIHWPREYDPSTGAYGAFWSRLLKEGACKLLKRWSGRRGSNPRRPAWETSRGL